ncbi:subunit of TIM23 translocase complex [Microbotryomycetes sp. JL221]|nr:subunit of TIM23 translocase complex [Microbotryomycetes sp. JL221]
MPPPPQAVHGAQEPTVFQKMKMGATMGGMVGLTIGFLFGGFAILRNGAGPRGFLPSLSGYMLSSGATFAFFMSIGTVIRTQPDMPGLLTAEATRTLLMRGQQQPMLASTQAYSDWKSRHRLQ